MSKPFKCLEKKPLTDAVIKLELDVYETLEYYEEYLLVARTGEFVKIYNELKGDFPLLLNLYRRIKKEGLTKNDIKDLIEIQRSIGEMQNAVGWLNKHVSEPGREKDDLEQNIATLRDIKHFLDE